MKSTQNYKSKCFSKNSSVWWMQGGGYDQGFHEICWISHEIHMKSARFHEIHWISKLWAFAWWSSIGLSFFERPIRRVFAETSDWSFDRKTYTWSSPKSSHSWNPADFTMKSSGFHHEIWQISWNPWNLVDFTMKSGRFQVKSDVSEIRCRCFSKNSSDFTRFGVDFTWNPPDFIRISWNPADFMWNRKTFARNCNSMFSYVCGPLNHECIHTVLWHKTFTELCNRGIKIFSRAALVKIFLYHSFIVQ